MNCMIVGTLSAWVFCSDYDRATPHLDMLPILHLHNIHLIGNDYLNRGQKVGTPEIRRQHDVELFYKRAHSLLILYARPQTQGTRNDKITLIEFRV